MRFEEKTITQMFSYVFSTFLAAADLDVFALLYMLDLGVPQERLAKTREGFTEHSSAAAAAPSLPPKKKVLGGFDT